MASTVFFETTPEEREHLKRGALGRGVVYREERADEADPRLLRGAEVLSVFIYSRLSAAVLKRAPRLKLIATRSTGFDHVDLSYCRRRGIAVANVPSYGENTVAEHTFALILALSRKVHQAYFRTIRGDFSFEGLQGFDLKGKTIGIVGTGHIGLHAARIAKGFGMRVLACDPHKNELAAETLGFEYASFDALLAGSDIVTLHAPYDPSTRHMINKNSLKKVKRGALLINTARGGLVETEALVEALDRGLLGGAGLDVLEGEELIKEERQILARDFSIGRLKTLVQNHILLNRENVVITPHIAFNSREAFARILDTTLANVRAFRAGKLENRVDRR
ncbi:MAG: hydroxyacid dehydrogenase [Elusimicrobia bacterium]|nr:hydroxyacid dehydrogenase [Elusimicrobiota bacterium]